MEQVWITKAGGPDVLRIQSVDDPVPGRREVLVDVAAVGVNFADLMARMGVYRDAPKIPCVIGYEVSGIVRACGPDVEDLTPGNRVFALTQFGGYSTVVSVPADQVFLMPETMSFQEAAALPVNYFTAYLALFVMGSLRSGQRCLIHSAGGGVGIAAVQLASGAGAEVYGTASTPKHEFLSSIGVDHLIDYRREDFAEAVDRLTGGAGVHLILDPVGGSSVRKGYGLLSPLGKIVCYGVSSAVRDGKSSLLSLAATALRMPRPHPVSLMNENRGILGLNLAHLWTEVGALRSAGYDLIRLYEAGQVKPVLAKAFPLRDASEAHRYLQERQNIGKVCLLIES